MEKETKLFSFPKIFTFKRGKRLTEENQQKGDIAYISSTKNNNGVSAYINPPDFMIRYKNKITLTNSGSVGYCFYHDYEFVASDHVTVIDIKDKNVILTRDIALYLKPILESIKYKYNFGREISDSRLKMENIMLPVDNLGNPDWSYMENYIEGCKKEVSFNPILSLNNAKLDLDISNWKEFKLTGKNSVFSQIYRGKRLKEEDHIKGEVNYYSASDKNNGLTDTIGNPLFIENDALIYTTFGDCYFVQGEFTASDEISIFKHPKMNLYNGLFIATVINESKYKYQFGRKAFYNKFINEIIKLPSTNSGEPDWDYMEKYIKNIDYGDKI